MKQQLSINYQNIKLLNSIKSIENWILKLKAERPKPKATSWLSYCKLPAVNCQLLLLFPIPFYQQYLVIIQQQVAILVIKKIS